MCSTSRAVTARCRSGRSICAATGNAAIRSRISKGSGTCTGSRSPHGAQRNAGSAVPDFAALHPGYSSLFAHPHQKLAEILALQQPEERLRRVLESLDHVFLVLDLALLQPRGDVASERLGLIREIRDDEAADGEALGQHLAEQLRRAVGASWQLVHVVLRDQPAHRDAGEIVEQGRNRIPDRAADVLEIDIDALRASLAQLV